MLSLRNRHFFLMDLVLLPAAAVLAFVLRLDATGLEFYASSILLYVAVSVPVKLTVREFQLLWHLITTRPRVASRDSILERVWGLSSEVETRTVDVHVRALVLDGIEVDVVRGIPGQGLVDDRDRALRGAVRRRGRPGRDDPATPIRSSRSGTVRRISPSRRSHRRNAPFGILPRPSDDPAD